MITLRKNSMEWSAPDVVPMSYCIGAEFAQSQRSRILPSLLRLAKARHVALSPRAERALTNAVESRRWMRALKTFQPLGEIPFTDAAIDNARMNKGTDPKWVKYFAHQRQDLNYIYRTDLAGYLLGHVPGAGKTLIAIRWAVFLKAKRVLVITTNAAKDQWKREFNRWGDGARVRIVEGTVLEQEAIIRRATSGCVVGHWESLAHAGDAYLAAPWNLVVLDEGHHIQNRDAQRTKTALQLDAPRRIVLTAHPYANAVSELFPILQFLFPEVYTSFWRFAHMHITIDPKPFGGLDLTTARRPKLLRWELLPFTLRRTKKHLKLPPVTRVPRTTRLTPHGRREYDKLRKELFVTLDAHDGGEKILAVPSILARITRLRQYLVDPALLGAREPSVKYPMIRDVMEEVGAPLVVFTEFKQAAIYLQQYLRKKQRGRVAVFHGGMAHKLEDLQSKFLRGRYAAVIMVRKAGKESLNFGKYGYLAHLDWPWNPRDLEQSEGRVDRPEEGTGKIVPTTAYYTTVKDSYEERMIQKNSDKLLDFSRVFTVSGLRELFA